MALRKICLAAATAIELALAAGTAAHAQVSYPDRPVRIVVPFASGGTADIVARIAAEQAGDHLGQRVYVENITGAGGSVGAAAAARAPADGYTLLLCNVSCAANQFLIDSPGYNPATDLAPVVVVAYVPNILVTGPSVQARTLADFLSLARANPGKLSMASSGPGSSSYLTAELLKFKARVDILDVPYRGSAGAMPDILAGRVDSMVMGLPESLPFVRDGKLTALGVTSDKRASVLPDVPTLAEAGVPDYAFLGWLSLFVPQRTLPAAIATLNAAFGKALASPRLSARYGEQSIEPGGGTPELAGRLLNEDVELWGRVLAGRKAPPARN
jgi:tripartite-type tricarboxylate transporter receptor subunit TctC